MLGLITNHFFVSEPKIWSSIILLLELNMERENIKQIKKELYWKRFFFLQKYNEFYKFN